MWLGWDKVNVRTVKRRDMWLGWDDKEYVLNSARGDLFENVHMEDRWT
jgi:hypothetical protein